MLIAAQGVARDTNGLYGAVALDLYRRGVAHVEGGVGNIAETLASAIKAQGGHVLYRHEVTAIKRAGARYTVQTKRGVFEADAVLANLTPWALAKLWGEDAPSNLRRRMKKLQPISGAFMAYLGVAEEAIEDEVDHHQVIVDPAKPLGEGNSIDWLSCASLARSATWARGVPPGKARAGRSTARSRERPNSSSAAGFRWITPPSAPTTSTASERESTVARAMAAGSGVALPERDTVHPPPRALRPRAHRCGCG